MTITSANCLASVAGILGWSLIKNIYVHVGESSTENTKKYQQAKEDSDNSLTYMFIELGEFQV